MRIRKPPRQIVIALVAVVLVNVVGLRSAYAVMGIADTGDAILAEMLVNAVKTLSVVEEGLAEARKTYDTAQWTAGRVQEAVAVTRAFQNFSLERFGERMQQSLRTAYPDVGRFQDFASNPRINDSYAGYSHAMTYCLSDAVQGKDACAHLKAAAETEKLSAMMDALYGRERKGAPRNREEAANDAQFAEIKKVMTELDTDRNTVNGLLGQMMTLNEQCQNLRNTDADCKDAAQRVQMMQGLLAAVQARIAANEAKLNSLRAAEETARRQREIDSAAAQAKALDQGAADLANQSYTIKTRDLPFATP